MDKFQGKTVKLKMTRMILDGGYFNDMTYSCKVISYEEEAGKLYLLTGKTELTEFSLDGVYECVLNDEDAEYRCTGMLEERYWNKLGKVIVFYIKKGFYKNTVN